MEQEFVPLDRVHVACDTGLLWEIIKGDAPWLGDFEQMARSGVVFSLADHALAEIVNQLEERIFTEAEYVCGIAKMALFISSDFPVLPGKSELFGWCSNTPDERRLHEDRLLGATQWELMTTAKSISDFERGMPVTMPDGSQTTVGLSPGMAKQKLDDERENWIEDLGPSRPGWRKRHIEDRLAELTRGIDASVPCDPPLRVRLDTAFRHEDAIIGMLSDPKYPFNPRKEKSRNDGIDYNMSYVYMKRVLLCSAEVTYTDFIRSLKSYQSSWIYRPDELVRAWKDGRLVRPQWPGR